MKIAVVGNCQSRGLARSIEAFLPGAEVTPYQLSVVAKGKHPVGSLENCYQEVTQADLALVINSKKPGWAHLFEKKVLEENCRNLIFYPNLAFSGYHPDCDYLPAFRRDSGGPQGPYHSTIAAASYRIGLSPARTVMLYNRFVYARLGFEQTYAASVLTMKQQDEALGFDLEAAFNTHRSNMHVINHPHVDVLKLIARQALTKAGLEFDAQSDPEVEDNLTNHRWPVYPGLFEAIPGSLVFRRGKRTTELADFIEQEFATFERLGGPDVITSPAIERAIKALEPVLVN